MSRSGLANSLSGITVLDFGQLMTGSVCGMSLADTGATVIKVEAPGGELGRKLGPPWVNGESLTALTSSRGKQGLCIDLKQPDATDKIRRIVARTDVMIENFRPGVMAGLGIDHEALRRVKPDLITCSLSAYGQTGTWRDRPGVDGIVQAASGLMSLVGASGSGPAKVPLPLADMTGALHATIAILATLRERDASGIRQRCHPSHTPHLSPRSRFVLPPDYKVAMVSKPSGCYTRKQRIRFGFLTIFDSASAR